MIDRFTQGMYPFKPHSVFQDAKGEALLYEECFTRDGFDGPFSMLYHRVAPTDQRAPKPSTYGWPAPLKAEDQPTRRHHVKGFEIPAGGPTLNARVPLFFNEDCILYVARPTESDPVYYANADGDDLYYIQRGTGALESSFGSIDFEPGDYLLVPRQVIHRLVFETTDNHLFITEGAKVELPPAFRNPAGQLRMDAPYSHRDFTRPTLAVDADGYGVTRAGPTTVVVKRGGRFTDHDYGRCPLDVVGWDGTVYPVKFPIRLFQPKVSSYHLPPNLHGTFQGERFVVCSFVPRLVDFGVGAIPCPYPHSNVHCDEVIFYDAGHFTSRKGIDTGSLSYHPAGLPHGPQPGAYEKSIGTEETNELAVMVDTFRPLYLTQQAQALDDANYHGSWLG